MENRDQDMNTKKNEEEKPCIDLATAEELFTMGKLGLKQLQGIINRAEIRGVDIKEMIEKMKRGKAAERKAKHLLETAFKKYKVKKKEV